MTKLLMKINESFELKYEYLRGLTGLQANELKNITNINHRNTTSLSKALKSSQNQVPIEGMVKDHLKPNDHIMCDVESHDLWIKLKLALDSPF